MWCLPERAGRAWHTGFGRELSERLGLGRGRDLWGRDVEQEGEEGCQSEESP